MEGGPTLGFLGGMGILGRETVELADHPSAAGPPLGPAFDSHNESEADVAIFQPSFSPSTSAQTINPALNCCAVHLITRATSHRAPRLLLLTIAADRGHNSSPKEKKPLQERSS